MPKIANMGSLIRIQRKKNEITIEKLAELCDVSSKCIGNIERNISIPRADTFLCICRELHITQLSYFYNTLREAYE